MLGLGLSLLTGGAVSPEYVKLSKAFVTRVEADGGTVESFACLKTDMAYLNSNPDAPTGYGVAWSTTTVGSSADFRITLTGGVGFTYTYAVTDSQANEVTGSGVMASDAQVVTADLSTLVDGTVTVAVYLTGAGGDGPVVTDTATLVGYTGLLDTYSGAAAAYSLRLLNTSYTGDAIVVRRASDNTTQSIGFVNNELDTATLESFCSGTDGFVTTWYDQSGNGNDVASATAAYQPKIVSAGSTITDGGKASISINEQVNQGLIIPIAASSTQDLFQVHKTNDTNFIIFRDNLSTARYVWAAMDSNASTVLSSNYGTPSLFVNGTSQNPQNRDALHSLLSTNNQVLISSIGGDSSAFTGNIRWGHYSSASIYDGNLQEIIFYNSDQSSNRSGIESNINTYYNIYP